MANLIIILNIISNISLGLFLPIIYRFIRSICYMNDKCYYSWAWLKVRGSLSVEEIRIIKYLMQYDAPIKLIEAMTGVPIVATGKNKNMGLADFSPQIEQGRQFYQALTSQQKYAISSLLSKNILIEECPNPFLGPFAEAKLNYPYQRKRVNA